MSTEHVEVETRTKNDQFYSLRPIALALLLVVGRNSMATDLDPVPIAHWPTDAHGPAHGVAVSDRYAYVVLGDSGLLVIDISDPVSPHRIGNYIASSPILGLAIGGNYLLLTESGWGREGDQLEIIDVTNPSAPQLRGLYRSPVVASTADVPLAVRGNYAYLAANFCDEAGCFGRLEIVDLSDPANPFRVGDTMLSGYVRSLAVEGQYVYAGGSWLEVIDARDPSKPRHAGNNMSAKGDIRSVLVSGNSAYVASLSCDSNSGCSGALEVFDVSDPTHPRRAGQYLPSGTISTVAVQGRSAFLALAGPSNGPPRSRVELIDICDPAAPKKIAGFETAVDIQASALQGNYAYLAAGEAGLQVISVTSNELRPVGGYETHVETRAVAVSGDYACVATRFFDLMAASWTRLTLLDVKDPSHPQELGRYQSTNSGSPNAIAFQGAQAWVVVATRDPKTSLSRGILELIDTTDPNSPKPVGEVATTALPTAIGIQGNHLYVTEYVQLAKPPRSRIEVFDITRATDVRALGSLDLSGSASKIAIQGSYGYFATANGLQVIDVSQPATPRLIGSYDTGSPVTAVAVLGHIACTTSTGDRGRLDVLDVSDPATPWRLGGYENMGGAASNLTLRDRRLYVGGWDIGLQLFDLSALASPRLIGRTSVPASDVSFKGDYGFLAADRGVFVVDTSHPANPQRLSKEVTTGSPAAFAIQGDYAYLALNFGEDSRNWSNQLQVLSLTNPTSPQRVGQYEIAGGSIRAVTVQKQRCYLAEILCPDTSCTGRLHVIDISNPANPNRIGLLTFATQILGMTVQGDYAYVGADGALQVIDIRNPGAFKKIGEYPYGAPRTSIFVTVQGDLAYLIADNLLKVIDITDPTMPRPVGSYTSIDWGFHSPRLIVFGDYAYVTQGEGETEIVDIRNPSNLQRVGNVVAGDVLAVWGNYAYVMGSGSPLQVFDVSDSTKPVRVGGNSNVTGSLGAAGAEYFYVAGPDGVTVLHPYLPWNRPLVSFTGNSELRDNTFRCALRGLPGVDISVERSTDLRNWEKWASLKLPRGLLDLRPAGTFEQSQFYRAKIE